jgi:RNA polymerase sigma-70 factor (ECF subfamily)
MELQTYPSRVMPLVGAPGFLKPAHLESPESFDPLAPSEMNAEGSVVPPANGEEWEVVQQAIAGSADAQQQLFTRHAGRLYRVAFALLRNKEDAEDAVQDGLYRAYTALRFFQGRSSFATWLTRIVVNSALMSRRRKNTRLETAGVPEAVVDVRPDPEKRCAATELSALLEKHLRQLPLALRTALRLGAIDGLSVAEASRALGISVSTFKSRTFRARRRLAIVLQQSRLQLADELA